MEALKSIFLFLRPALPLAVTLIALAAALLAANLVFERRLATQPNRRILSQITMLILTALGLVAAILVSPLSEARTGQLLGLIGLLGSAAIALSSTTFLGNALAGIMLRAVRSYRIGDFLRVGEHFGRVSEQGLFHTEIQTENRDLITLPNLYLVTHPVQVIRSTGTVVSATVSLGYGVHHSRVEELLKQAALAAELEEGFVHVTQLGDFAVTYRVAGLLVNIKEVISAKSRLRQCMLDALHAGGVEIVSPTFMNQRALPPDGSVIPEDRAAAPAQQPGETAEAIAFDKAEAAGSIEELRERHEGLGRELEAARERIKKAPSKDEKHALEAEAERIEAARERLTQIIRQRTDALGS